MDYNRFKELKRRYYDAPSTYYNYMPKGWRKLSESFIRDPEKSVAWNREYVAENNRKFEEYDKIARQKAREEVTAVDQELFDFCMETFAFDKEKVKDLFEFCKHLEACTDYACDKFEILEGLIEIFLKKED